MKTVFDVSADKLNNTSSRESDSSWKYIDELTSLNNRVNDVKSALELLETRLTTNLDSQYQKLDKRSQILTEEIETKLNSQIKESKQSVSGIVTELNDLKRNLVNKINSYDKEHTQRDTQIYNTISSLTTRLNRVFFDGVEQQDQYVLHWMDPDGKTDLTRIKKPAADEDLLTCDNGVISFKYKFSPRNFEIKNDVIRCTSLTLDNGRTLNGDRISNDLNNATFNIEQLTEKVSSILTKINTLNGYVASNNFKKAEPSQTQLTNFAIECLPSSTTELSLNSIPTGTKIKNTFDNHIWILNRVTIEGLTTTKWEDFGSDNICIASNDGVHGLVAGSSEKFKGHIDLKGIISINGLEEELTGMLESLLNLSTTLTNVQANYDKRFLELESRIRYLEENK